MHKSLQPHTHNAPSFDDKRQDTKTKSAVSARTKTPHNPKAVLALAVLSKKDKIKPLPRPENAPSRKKNAQDISIIYSDSYSDPSPPRRRKKNRKHATRNHHYDFQGERYPINSKKSGCYTPILKKAMETMHDALSRYKRIILIRMDFHQPSYTKDSKNISKFLKNLRAKTKRHYDAELHYLWVREKEKAKSQHYHMAFFLITTKSSTPATSEVWR